MLQAYRQPVKCLVIALALVAHYGQGNDGKHPRMNEQMNDHHHDHDDDDDDDYGSMDKQNWLLEQTYLIWFKKSVLQASKRASNVLAYTHVLIDSRFADGSERVPSCATRHTHTGKLTYETWTKFIKLFDCLCVRVWARCQTKFCFSKYQIVILNLTSTQSHVNQEQQQKQQWRNARLVEMLAYRQCPGGVL